MYNNIKNFVKPQYAALFMVCIGCLLLLIFTKSRIEGFVGDRDFKDLKKDVKDQDRDIKGLKTSDNTQDRDIKGLQSSDKTQDRDIKGLQTSDTAQTGDITGLKSQIGTEISKLNASYENLNKEFATVKGSISGLATKVETAATQSIATASANTSEIAAANAKAIADFNSTMSLNMKEFDSKKTGIVADLESKNAELLAKNTEILDTRSAELLKQNAALIQNLDSKQSEIMKNLDSKEKEISNSLYNQSTMYKTGLQNDSKVFQSISNEAKTAVMSAKGETIDAKESAKESAASAEDVYRNVFGKSTFDSVRIATTQPPTATRQAFTTMFSGSNFVPNTDYYETFVQREQFATPDFTPKAGSDTFTKLENNILSAANDFNNEYAKYILAENKDKDTLRTKATKLNDALIALKNAYPESGITHESAKTIHAEDIIAKSKEIDALRQNLDAKMENILKGKAPQNEFTNEYDSTVYTGVLWSILGTSLLYYIFTEL